MNESDASAYNASSGNSVEKREALYLYGAVFRLLMASAVLTVNVPIFVAISNFEKLREQKEYVMVAGLALADIIDGATYLCAGMARLLLIYTGKGWF